MLRLATNLNTRGTDGQDFTRLLQPFKVAEDPILHGMKFINTGCFT